MKTILALLLLAVTAFAGDINLAWDASPATDDAPVSGYEISYGEAAGAWTQRLDVGNVLTANVPNLAQGKTFFFVVRAYNTEGYSLPSNEVSAKIIGVPGVPQQLRITPKKLSQLDDKLRVEKKQFVAFKTGTASDCARRILASREILELSMNKQDATHQ